MPELTKSQLAAYSHLDEIGVAAMKTMPPAVFDAIYDTLELYGVDFANVDVRRAFHAIGKYIAEVAQTAEQVDPNANSVAITALTKISVSLVACAGYASTKAGKVTK